MLQKIKKIWHKYKKLIKWVIILVILIVLSVILYKMLFYSTDEKSVYGVRLNEIKEHKITDSKLEKLKKDSKVEKVSDVNIKIKGKLIKYFILFDEGVSKDEIKGKVNDMLGLLDENIKGFYDITFYIRQNTGDDEKYIMLGYKHKTKDYVVYDEF